MTASAGAEVGRGRGLRPDLVERVLSAGVSLAGGVGALALAVVLADAVAAGREAQAVTLVGLAALLTITALRPEWGLLGWLLLAPFGRLFNLAMGHGLPDLGLNRVAILALLMLLVAQVAARRRRLPRVSPVEWAGAVFLLGMALSIPASRLGIVGGLQNVFDTVAVPLLSFYFARALLGSEGGLRRLALTLALVGAVLGLIAAREQLTNQAILAPLPYRWAYGRYSVKVTSIFGSPAIMSLTLAMTAPLVFFAAVRAQGWWRRIAWGAALAAIFAGLLLTYVRAGWLAGAAGLAVVIVLSQRARRYALVVAPVVLAVVLLFSSGAFDARAIQERLDSEGPIEYRMQAWEVGLELAARSPVLGLGLDNYSDAAIAAGWQPTGAVGTLAVAAHNLFFYVLISAGLAGLLPLLVLLALLGWRTFQLWRQNRRALAGPDPGWLAAALGAWAGYLLYANTIDALHAQLANILFFVIMGAALGAHEKWQTRAPSPLSAASTA